MRALALVLLLTGCSTTSQDNSRDFDILLDATCESDCDFTFRTRANKTEAGDSAEVKVPGG